MLEPDRPRDAERVSSFVELHADGSVTVFTGKVELGTGVATALAQIVAGELGLTVDQIRMEMGDTGRTPKQGGTTGSKTLQQVGPRLRLAAQVVRDRLLEVAAEHLEVSPTDLILVKGEVRPRDGSPAFIPLGDLADVSLDLPMSDYQLNSSWDNTLVGKSEPRTDLAGKITGVPAFVHDLVLPGMVHGRVIRPWRRTPDGCGRIRSVDITAARTMPGVIEIVRDGDFLAVVAEQEWQAIRAADAVKVEYEDIPLLPAEEDQFQAMLEATSYDTVPFDTGDVDAALDRSRHTLSATYTFPFQAHGSTGPSCAVADVRTDGATVYSSSQDIESLRIALAPLLDLPLEQVRLVFREGAGCYGQNGSDDVAADAALLSQAVGRPVRVQWMRRDEFAWEPKSPAMRIEMSAGLTTSGDLAGWQHRTWTATHTNRPGGQAGRLLAGREVTRDVLPPTLTFGGGNRNANTTYAFPAERVTMHWLANPPLHTSAMRSLGGLHNTTANECFMDEVAFTLGEDPVAMRRRYLDDPRAVAVVDAAAERSDWGVALEAPDGFLSGRGFAFARYECEFSYVAMVVDVLVQPTSGVVRVTRVVVAHDCGLIINPDGVRNQIEGNVIQGISRSLHEAIHWDSDGQTTLTWETYRILTFPEVPEIEIMLIDRPEQPSWGAGEPAICPVTAAIGNAIHAATGVRLRAIPFTPERVRAGIASWRTR